ncbi:hypothetical protein SEA_SAFTANT_52 [Streptomyces phage Saftant]|uniref:Transglycosylase SLT domain-containing protein n=1 Tax=Streptomyces phage Saftant TaxID=2601693 RepID=A0A5J6D8B5_9CAUD|nr:hypothetical protein KGG95_gp52 [Streptomyces phage Saftant]QEQ94084.1 hypothetical protein SEA_SAFTANT_52 [Streptomyces phage Saftant]
MAAGVTALTSALSLGMLGGALLVDKTKDHEPQPIHDTQPIPTVTATVTVTPKPKPSKTSTSRSSTRTVRPLQTPREIGRELAAERGWTGAEWTALEDLWTRESGWNPHAQNPTSTAYGIAQFLDSTWAGYGIAKTSDARLQIKAGLRYIAARYGTPSNALGFWLRQSPHWY